MQPIIWLAIMGVAGMGLGMGFLAPGFTLNVQQLGAQETLLESPINTANVDFTISKIEGINLAGDTVYKNRIVRCSFHTPTDLEVGSAIICKLTDKDRDIVAEGRLNLLQPLEGSLTTYIHISQVAFPNANDVQNIEDVKIIVLGPKPAGFP
jgi:hypothetical protein